MANFLKRLELVGFKSFAQKTSLDFPVGITAIVGPNGSGKSNVVDAVRWLLGEREAKNLRGAKVEDLIFAGTPKRSRVGQAQASIHFDNRHKIFPVDFSEVSVARQVSRDGQSQYFVNKSEVRLKDVVDLFAKARLGTKGLVVVTQGNSDVFVRATPQGRREMIEEMLGLREFQIKKADAERRLKNSEINLEKVRALTEEILPHLRSLKRQTNRWEKRGMLEGELREFEQKFFGSQFSSLGEKAAEIEREIEQHQKEFKSLDVERESASRRMKEVESNQPKERAEIEKIKKETQGLLENRSRIQKEIGRLEAQIELSDGLTESRSISAEPLLELLKKIKHGLEAYIDEDDIEELRHAIERFVNEIDEALSGNSAPERVRPPEALVLQLKTINKELKELDAAIRKLKEDELALEKNQEGFYAAFKSAAEALEGIRNRMEKWESEHQKKLFEKERLVLREQELKRQIVQLEREPIEFLHYRGEAVAEPELSALERQIFKYRGDLASIGEIDEALVKEAKETEERYRFLSHESEDLESAIIDLKKLIKELGEKVKTEFGSALHKINEEFGKFFHLMFDGGHAKLTIKKQAPNIKPEGEGGEAGQNTENANVPEEEAEEGVEIELSLPRKRIKSLEVLSGGEKSLVGIAGLFALISVSPPPFLVLDEVDAPLDDRNAHRFAEMLKEFSKEIQFVIVTHNRTVMEAADVLYGVTMNEDGTSKVLSLNLEPAPQQT